MLAGRGGAQGELEVHGVGQDDVDGLNVGIVLDGVERRVIVDAAFGDAVLRGDGKGLFPVAADERGAAYGLRLGEARQDLFEREMADADYGDAEALPRRLRVCEHFAALARRVQGRQLYLPVFGLAEEGGRLLFSRSLSGLAEAVPPPARPSRRGSSGGSGSAMGMLRAE